MKSNLLIVILLVVGFKVFGQISPTDATIQTLANWHKGEQRNYTVLVNNVEMEDLDTTATIRTTYEVEITVKDQIDQVYLIEWRYKNIETTMPIPEVMDLLEDLKVVFKMEASGVFMEIVNLQEIQGFIHEAVNRLKKRFEDMPFMENAVAQVEAMYATREAIEAYSIQDIRQFHLFHGRQYKSGETVTGLFQQPSLKGDTLLDAPFEIQVENINRAEQDYRLRMTKAVNQEQFTKAVQDYLAELTEGLDIELFADKDLTDLKNETHTVAVINDAGWVKHSVQTTRVSVLGNTNIEERTIKLMP